MQLTNRGRKTSNPAGRSWRVLFEQAGGKNYSNIMNHASVCTGVGMFELAAAWNGWDNVFTSEIDKYCSKLLAKRYPNTNHHGDFTTESFFEFANQQYRDRIDVLSAGLPCQPFSSAGKRMGQKDGRHLSPSFIELCQIIRPAWIHLENVTDFIEMAFDDLASALETQGYQVGEPLVLPASSVGACHQRYRMFFIAYNPTYAQGIGQRRAWDSRSGWPGFTNGHFNDTANPNGSRQPQPERAHQNESGRTGNSHQKKPTDPRRINGQIRVHGGESTAYRQANEPTNGIAGFDGWQTHWLEVATRIHRMANGDAGGVDEYRYGSRSLANGTFGRHKTQRLKACGNALIPHIPYEFFRLIDSVTNAAPI